MISRRALTLALGLVIRSLIPCRVPASNLGQESQDPRLVEAQKQFAPCLAFQREDRADTMRFRAASIK